jgi:DNA-binding IclR family transcriptional regulator
MSQPSDSVNDDAPGDPVRRESQGVQGVEIGLRVASSLARAAGPMTLGELAEATGLHPSKTHRYLVSLCRSGLLEQDGRNGKYDLGPEALVLGLAALGRLDAYRLLMEAVERLHGLTEATISCTVWGTHGPTVIGRKEALRSVTINTRVGSVLPLATSAAGRLYAAFLPRAKVEPILAQEEATGPPTLTWMGKPMQRSDLFPVIVDSIRRERMSCVQGDLLIGIDAVAVPVFDQTGEIAFTMSVIAPHGSLDLGPTGGVARIARTAADELSVRLGYRPPTAPETTAARRATRRP